MRRLLFLTCLVYIAGCSRGLPPLGPTLPWSTITPGPAQGVGLYEAEQLAGHEPPTGFSVTNWRPKNRYFLFTLPERVVPPLQDGMAGDRFGTVGTKVLWVRSDGRSVFARVEATSKRSTSLAVIVDRKILNADRAKLKVIVPSGQETVFQVAVPPAAPDQAIDRSLPTGRATIDGMTVEAEALAEPPTYDGEFPALETIVTGAVKRAPNEICSASIHLPSGMTMYLPGISLGEGDPERKTYKSQFAVEWVDDPNVLPVDVEVHRNILFTEYIDFGSVPIERVRTRTDPKTNPWTIRGEFVGSTPSGLQVKVRQSRAASILSVMETEEGFARSLQVMAQVEDSAGKGVPKELKAGKTVQLHLTIGEKSAGSSGFNTSGETTIAGKLDQPLSGGYVHLRLRVDRVLGTVASGRMLLPIRKVSGDRLHKLIGRTVINNRVVTGR